MLQNVWKLNLSCWQILRSEFNLKYKVYFEREKTMRMFQLGSKNARAYSLKRHVKKNLKENTTLKYQCSEDKKHIKENDFLSLIQNYSKCSPGQTSMTLWKKIYVDRC